MKIRVEKIAFILISLIIVAVAYLPALNLGGSCLTCTRNIVANSQVHVYGGPVIAQWDIQSLDLQVTGSPNQGQSLSLWYPTGQVCAVYRLLDSGDRQIQSGTVCNPNVMDWGGAGSTWQSSWTFSHLSNGAYSVGVTYYENNVAKTNELKKGVMVT